MLDRISYRAQAECGRGGRRGERCEPTGQGMEPSAHVTSRVSGGKALRSVVEADHADAGR